MDVGFAFERRNQHTAGFSFIEFMVVLVLIIIATIILLNLLNSGRSSNQVDAESKALSSLRTRISGIYAGRPNYATISTADLVQQKAFIENRIDGSVVRNVWGGTVVVSPANIGAAFNNGYTVQYTNVPSASCNDFATTNDEAAAVWRVNGVTVKTFAFRLDLTALAGPLACGAGDGNVVELDVLS